MSGKGRSVGHYWIGTLFRPAAAFRRLLEDRRRFVKGFGAVLLGGLFYALAAAGLGAAGAVPMIPVVAGGTAENYYFWQLLFTVPLVVTCWILSTAVLFVLTGRRGKKRGGAPFKGMLALTGFALTAPFWLTWAFKGVTAVLMFMGMGQEEWVEALSRPGLLQTLFFCVQAVALVWSWILVSLSAALSRKVGGLRAVLAGLAAEAVFILPMIVFIR